MRPVFQSKFNLGSGDRDLIQGSAARNCQIRSSNFSPLLTGSLQVREIDGHPGARGVPAPGACARWGAGAPLRSREVGDPGPQLSPLLNVLVRAADRACSFRDQYACSYSNLKFQRALGALGPVGGGPRLQGAAVLGSSTTLTVHCWLLRPGALRG